MVKNVIFGQKGEKRVKKVTKKSQVGV